MNDYGLPVSMYTEINDSELDVLIAQIKADHPHVGEVMLNGHLRSRGIVLQRHRLRQAVRRVDSQGVEARRTTTIYRRVYSLPCPNYIWHIDGNHKLVRWKFVVHGAIDGFSRMVMFLKCSNNNRAETVHCLFQHAVQQFGRPLKVRTDLGGENVAIWEDMRQNGGEDSVLTGSSVHNQRIERFNRDLNRNCSSVYSPIFYDLEASRLLDPDNRTDLFCLHYVYLPRIDRTLQEFKDAYNHHALSTEGNATPMQLYWGERHLLDLHSAEPRRGPHLQSPILPSPVGIFCPLGRRDMLELSQSLNPLSDDGRHGKALLQRVQEFIFRKLTTGD